MHGSLAEVRRSFDSALGLAQDDIFVERRFRVGRTVRAIAKASEENAETQRRRGNLLCHRNHSFAESDRIS